MRRLVWAASACLLVCSVILTAAVTQIRAAANDIVIDIDTAVPVFGSSVTGTFTITPAATTGATEQGTWSFTGTVAGQPATAHGQGQGTVQDKQTIAFDLTTIDEWQMGPLPRPVAPASITLRSEGSTVSLTWNRLGLTGQFAVSPALSVSSAASGGHYRLTNASAGSQTAVQTLPKTGAGTANVMSGAPAAMLISLGLAALCAIAGLWLRQSGRDLHHPHRHGAAGR